MAGPCAAVVLPECTSDSLRCKIDAWVDAISELRKASDFWVTDSSSIGGSYQGRGRPFFFRLTDIDAAPADEWCDPNAEELAQVANEFGFEPKSSVSFCAMCNDACDHQVLAELCLATAKALGGVIDFDGTISSPDYALDGLPGRLRAVFFDRRSPGSGFSHYCDADFLAAWIQHPAFRMVK